MGVREQLHRYSYGPGPRLMSALRKRWVRLLHPRADIRFGEGVHLGPGFSLHIPDDGSFHVGPGTEFRRNFRAEVYGDGRITIGAGCYFTYNVLMACSTTLEIGDRCGMALSSSIYDGNHRYEDTSTPFLDQGYEFREVRLADDVQIHALCTILASIGERTVIGANSVVTKSLPGYCLAVGAPARPIRHFGPETLAPDTAT